MNESFSYPSKLDTPEFKDKWLEYLQWRKDMGKSYAWKKPANTKKRWLKKLAEWGEESAINALDHCMINEYQGLFPAPYKAQNKAPEKATNNTPDERWRDLLKVVLKECPEYIEGGWPEQRCLDTGYHALPFTLRQEIQKQARDMGIKLRL